MSKSSMKMISPGVEVEPDGTTKQILHVLFTDTEGNEVRYRWEELKKVVLEWIEIEESEECPKGTHESLDEALGCWKCQNASLRAWRAKNEI
jgi:hypothetical protein